MINIGINGFGRIGRLILRAILENYRNKINVVAINDLIARANVIDVTKIENNGKVIFGSTVKLQDLENDKKINYKLVGQDEADIKKNLIFFKSPIGKALVGKDKGEMIKLSKGTTTLAFVFKGGVVVAVDSRASQGSYVGSQTVKKGKFFVRFLFCKYTYRRTN